MDYSPTVCPWDSLGKNTGLGSQSFLQGIFLNQESNLGLSHCRQILYHTSHQGSPENIKHLSIKFVHLMWAQFLISPNNYSESESRSVMSLCNDMDCPWNSPARILEWVAFPFSRGSSQPRDWTKVSCIAGGFFTNWAIRKVLNNYISNCEDHWSKDIMMKKFEILWELPKCDREMKWATVARKIVPIDLLNTGLPQIFLL